jgi:hypothetical protein
MTKAARKRETIIGALKQGIPFPLDCPAIDTEPDDAGDLASRIAMPNERSCGEWRALRGGPVAVIRTSLSLPDSSCGLRRCSAAPQCSRPLPTLSRPLRVTRAR